SDSRPTGAHAWGRDECHLLGGIARARRPPAAAASPPRPGLVAVQVRAVEFVRHIWVSRASAIPPPSNFAADKRLEYERASWRIGLRCSRTRSGVVPPPNAGPRQPICSR